MIVLFMASMGVEASFPLMNTYLITLVERNCDVPDFSNYFGGGFIVSCIALELRYLTSFLLFIMFGFAQNRFVWILKVGLCSIIQLVPTMNATLDENSVV